MYVDIVILSNLNIYYDSLLPLATNSAPENTISPSPESSVSNASRIPLQQIQPSASFRPATSPRILRLHFQSLSSLMGGTQAASWTWKSPAASSRTAASLMISSVPTSQLEARDLMWSLALTRWSQERTSEESTIMSLIRPRLISPRSACFTPTS